MTKGVMLSIIIAIFNVYAMDEDGSQNADINVLCGRQLKIDTNQKMINISRLIDRIVEKDIESVDHQVVKEAIRLCEDVLIDTSLTKEERAVMQGALDLLRDVNNIIRTYELSNKKI